MLGAHHDTAPDAPGAYDDGAAWTSSFRASPARAGQGRAARARSCSRRWDAEESPGPHRLRAGARLARAPFVDGRGRAAPDRGVQRRDVAGWKGSRPVLPADPARGPGPAGTLRGHAGLAGCGRRCGHGRSRSATAVLVALPAGRAHIPRDPVRRRHLVLAGRTAGALYAPARPSTSFYPLVSRRPPTPRADKLRRGRAQRCMGGGALRGAGRAPRVPPGPDSSPDWFGGASALRPGPGRLWTIGLLSLVPLGLRAGRGGLAGLLSASMQGLLAWCCCGATRCWPCGSSCFPTCWAAVAGSDPARSLPCRSRCWRASWNRRLGSWLRGRRVRAPGDRGPRLRPGLRVRGRRSPRRASPPREGRKKSTAAARVSARAPSTSSGT